MFGGGVGPPGLAQRLHPSCCRSPPAGAATAAGWGTGVVEEAGRRGSPGVSVEPPGPGPGRATPSGETSLDPPPLGRVLLKGGGSYSSEVQKFVYQKHPKPIFPSVNFHLFPQ